MRRRYSFWAWFDRWFSIEPELEVFRAIERYDRTARARIDGLTRQLCELQIALGMPPDAPHDAVMARVRILVATGGLNA